MGDRAVTFSRVEKASESDEEICNLRRFLLEDDGSNRLPEELSHYNRYRDRLSVLGSCVMYDRRVLVPSALRKEVLKGLHAAHQGVVSMSNRAQQVVFWPGIFKDLEIVRATCRDCCARAPSQPAMPPAPLTSPEYPFHMLVADYCGKRGL